jgi:hypothetical protein
MEDLSSSVSLSLGAGKRLGVDPAQSRPMLMRGQSSSAVAARISIHMVE